MTPILKKQLTLLCGTAVLAGALLWSSGSLRAQETSGRASGIRTPRIPLTRDEAARNFVLLLESLQKASGPTVTPETQVAMMSSFSVSSEKSSLLLLERMARQWKEPQANVKVLEENADSARVIVEAPPEAPPVRPLVLVREGVSWGVDIGATYAEWNGIKGEDKEKFLASLLADGDRARENARRSSCQSNLKQIGLGIAQYCQDYDEKMPPAKEWIDVVKPYVQSEQMFRCPEVTDAEGYGYAFNSKFSKKNLAVINEPALSALVYETSVLKRNAYGIGENPAFRHQNGSNYTFADGHVKWFSKENIPSFKLGSGASVAIGF